MVTNDECNLSDAIVLAIMPVGKHTGAYDIRCDIRIGRLAFEDTKFVDL